MGISAANNLTEILIRNSTVGTVNVSRLRRGGRFLRRRSSPGVPISFSGVINFEQKNYDPNPVDLDPDTNALWCKGSEVEIYGLRPTGGEGLLKTMVIKRTKVTKEDSQGRVRAILVELTDFLGEENAKGMDVVTIAPSGSTRRALVQAALEKGTNRALTYELEDIGEDVLNGAIPLLRNQSPAGLAAQLAAPELAYIYVTNSGAIKSKKRRVSSDGTPSPVLRRAFSEFVRNERIDQIEDIADEVCVSSQLTVLVPNPLPFSSESVTYARASDIFPNPAIGNDLVFKKVETFIDMNGLQTRTVTEPLAGFVTFSNVEGYDSAQKPLLLSYHSYTETDSFKQYDIEGKLLTRTFEREGPVAVFRENFNPTLEDVFGTGAGDPSDLTSVLTNITLENQERIQYTDGLPLDKDGYEESLTGNWLNGGTSTDAPIQVGRTEFVEKWSDFGENQFVLERLSGNPALGRQVVKEGPTGPPQPEFRQPLNQTRQVLIEDTYTTDTGSLNCGVAKAICINVPYAKLEMLLRLGQWELERRISQSRARAFTLGLPEFMFDWEPFQVIHVGKKAYEIDAELVEWDENLQLFCRFEGHEIGDLATEVQPTRLPNPVFPASATPVPGPITGGGCPAPVVVPTPPTTLTISAIADRTIVVGECVNIPVSAIGGTPEYFFDDDGTLPPNFSVNSTSNTTAVITGTATQTFSGTVDIEVEDDDLATDSTNFVFTIAAPERPTFPVPAQSFVRSSLGVSARVFSVPYETETVGVQTQSALGFSANVTVQMTPTAVQSAVGFSSKITSPSTIPVALGFSVQVTSGGAVEESFTTASGANFETADDQDFQVAT